MPARPVPGATARAMALELYGSLKNCPRAPTTTRRASDPRSAASELALFQQVGKDRFRAVQWLPEGEAGTYLCIAGTMPRREVDTCSPTSVAI